MSAIVFLSSLLAIPTSYCLNNIFTVRQPLLILFCGVFVLSVMIGIPYLYIRNRRNVTDRFFYVLGIFTFSSVIDLIIALENDGIIDDFMEFYLREGEPYLRTSHGTMICYWDGIAHYAMYLVMLTAQSWNQNYREVGLFWVGSIVHSMFILLPGGVIGKYPIKWVIFLNVPYLVIPIWVGVNLLQDRPRVQVLNIDDNQSSKWAFLKKNPKAILFLIFFLGASLVAVLRAFAVLGGDHIFKYYLINMEPYLMDPSAFPKIQMLVYLFYFLPYYISMIIFLLSTQTSLISWVIDFSFIHAGAAAQAQFSHIGSSLHYRTPYSLRVPQRTSHWITFWGINLSLLMVPQLFMIYCQSKVVPIVEEEGPDIKRSMATMNSQESLDAIDRLVENASRNRKIALQPK
ncbi:transmembrane 6 superfamily member 1 [Octopus sinensis]|uniref:Transmembrane 6 superfamily member 1 n=1 Tax=Octopus sinensis TaxID=2607531 RepID=A0A6P7T6P2_9MOLL|nr:transmembrane 6 superfamily member 1 [Octopus sinensis]